MEDTIEIVFHTTDWLQEDINEAQYKIDYYLGWIKYSRKELQNGRRSQKRHMKECKLCKNEIRHWRERYRVLTRKREGLA